MSECATSFNWDKPRMGLRNTKTLERKIFDLEQTPMISLARQAEQLLNVSSSICRLVGGMLLALVVRSATPNKQNLKGEICMRKNRVIISGMVFSALTLSPVVGWSQSSPGTSGPSTEQNQQRPRPPASSARSSTDSMGSASMNGQWSREDVRSVQEALKGKGHNPGPVDGVIGPRTQQALRAFQRAQNIQTSGQLDNSTASALGVTLSSGSSSTPSSSGRSSSGAGSSGSGTPSDPSSRDGSGTGASSSPTKSGSTTNDTSKSDSTKSSSTKSSSTKSDSSKSEGIPGEGVPSESGSSKGGSSKSGSSKSGTSSD